MSRTITPVVNTNSFQAWVAVTNNLVTVIGQTVTIAANASGDFTTGNGFVTGIFGANTLVATTIRGGNVANVTAITFASNANFSGIVNVAANTVVYANSITFGSNASSIVITISSNATSSDLVIGGNSATLSANLFLNGTVFRPPSGNTSQRPTGSTGYVRFNTDLGLLELFTANTWNVISVGNLIASAISFSPNLNVASNTVQDAINETYNEKVSKAGDSMSGNLVINQTGSALPTPVTGTVLQLASADTVGTIIELDAFGAQTTFAGRRADGTNASKTAIVTNDVISALVGYGYNGNNYVTPGAARILLNAGENWSVANNGTYITVEVTTNGSVTRVTAANVSSNAFVIGSTFLVVGGNTLANNVTVTGTLAANVVSVSGISTFNANVVANATNVIVNNGFVRVGNNTIFSYINQNGISSDGTTYNAFWHGGNLVNPVSYVAGGISANSYSGNGVANTAQYLSNTSGKILSTDQVWAAMTPFALTSNTTVTWSMSSGIDFTLTLATNATLAFPTVPKVGQRGRIRIAQDATGSRTLALASGLQTSSSLGVTLSTTASAVDYLYYDCISASIVLLSLYKAAGP